MRSEKQLRKDTHEEWRPKMRHKWEKRSEEKDDELGN